MGIVDLEKPKGQIVIEITDQGIATNISGTWFDPVGVLERVKLDLMVNPPKPQEKIAKPDGAAVAAINKSKGK